MFFCVCSSFKSLLSVNPFARSPALSPTLYKFIIFGSLGSYPRFFGLGLRIVTLQLAPSVGKKSFQCETSKKNAKAPTGLALGLEAKNVPTIMFDLQYFFFINHFDFFHNPQNSTDFYLPCLHIITIMFIITKQFFNKIMIINKKKKKE